VNSKPGVNVEAEVRKIFELFSTGEFAAGLGQARRLHQQYPNLAISNYCVGHGLAATDRSGAAVEFFKRAVELQPDNPEFLVRYGRVLLNLSQILEAEAALNKAYKLNPKLPIGIWTLAQYYASIDRFDLAESYFRMVLGSDLPSHIRESVHMDLVRVLIEVGNFSEAENELRDAIPSNLSLAFKSNLQTQLRPIEIGSPEHRMVENALAGDLPDNVVRSSFLRANARIYEKAGDLEREYQLIEQSTALTAEKFSYAGFQLYIDQVIASFQGERVRRLQDEFGTSPFAPIYVVGLPRSGTTLTEKILSSHSQVGGAGELSMISTVNRNILGGRAVQHFEEAIRSLPLSTISDWVNGVETNMRYLCPGRERIVDKMPHNFLHCGLIRILFPRSRIIHCYRDPADNFLSGFKASLKSAYSYFYAPEVFSDYYGCYRKLMNHWYSTLGEAIFPLCYEDLVQDPRKVISALLNFCDLDWEEGCLSPENNTSRIGTASVVQARNPINSSSVGGWKRYASKLNMIKVRHGENYRFPGS
jgi:tetratricopeptide (TPR) repeat protein